LRRLGARKLKGFNRIAKMG